MGKVYDFCDNISPSWGWIFGLAIFLMLSPILVLLAFKENYLDMKKEEYRLPVKSDELNRHSHLMQKLWCGDRIRISLLRALWNPCGRSHMCALRKRPRTGCSVLLSLRGRSLLTVRRRDTAAESLLGATGLSLQQAAPQTILDACQDCLQKNPSADDAALASVMAMHAYAKLGRFAEAKDHVIKARQFYAVHLGLTPEQRELYVSEPYLIDDLRPAGDRDLENNPWLWPLLGHAESPLLPDS